MNACVYAICKNEEKNIIKWLDSVYRDSDLIVLVDTGSIDNTINLANHYNDYDNKIYFYDYYEMKDQKEFSFSNARNYCLDKAKNIIPTLEFGILNLIFISLDIDEFICENGIKKIKNIWNLNYDTVQLISISDGIKIPVNHKVHGYNFHWERDVHEIIVRDDGLREKDWNILLSDIEYDHVQDKSKQRDYLKLLLNSYNKGDISSKTLSYIAWEYHDRKQYDKCFKFSDMAQKIISSNINDENYMNYEYLIWLYGFKVNCCIEEKDYRGARTYLEYIISYFFSNNKFPKLRFIYKRLAEVCWELGDKNSSINYYNEALEVQYPGAGYFVEDYTLYSKRGKAILHSDLSNSYWYNGNKQYSLIHAKNATGLDPKNEAYINNLNIIENSIKIY